jgi:molybdopterin-binding protein
MIPAGPHVAGAFHIHRSGIQPSYTKGDCMALSARNQLPGTVTRIKEGAVMAEVIIQLENGPEIVSVITVDSVHRLKLATGSRVRAIVKATEVMVSSDEA